MDPYTGVIGGRLKPAGSLPVRGFQPGTAIFFCPLFLLPTKGWFVSLQTMELFSSLVSCLQGGPWALGGRGAGENDRTEEVTVRIWKIVVCGWPTIAGWLDSNDGALSMLINRRRLKARGGQA